MALTVTAPRWFSALYCFDIVVKCELRRGSPPSPWQLHLRSRPEQPLEPIFEERVARLRAANAGAALSHAQPRRNQCQPHGPQICPLNETPKKGVRSVWG